MRNFSTLTLISAAAAVSFFCATAVHSTDLPASPTILVAGAR